jgi:exonuclease SbcC
MRPVHLALEGFGVFRDRTDVDLDDVELFAIVGKTGDGKSTLIDAICFALYGSVPRYGERDLAPLISLGSNEAKVSFTFALGADTYVATRVVRRKPKGPGATTRGVRLERRDGDKLEPVAGNADEFADWVKRSIGLDFSQFTKCVVLPQGRFAAFLNARPGERTAILSALLDLGRYEEMAKAARDRATAAGIRREVLDNELEKLGRFGDDARSEVATRAARLDELIVAIDTAVAEDARAARAVEAARAELDRLATQAAACAAVVPSEELSHLLTRVEDAEKSLHTAMEQEHDARYAFELAEQAIAALPPAGDLERAIAQHEEHARLSERIAKGEITVAAGADELQRTKQVLVDAEAAATAAEVAFDAAQRDHAHLELRAALVVGEPCPVCEAEVVQLPARRDPKLLAKAKTALTKARTARQAATDNAQQALSAFDTATALLDELRDRYAALTSTLEGEMPSLRAQLGEVHTAAGELATARAAVTNAVEHKRRTEQEATEARTALPKLQAVFERQRDQVLAGGLTPPATTGELTADWSALTAFATERMADIGREEDEVRSAIDALSRAGRERVDALAQRAGADGVAARGPSLADLSVAAVETQRATALELARIDAARARADEIERERATAHDAELVATTLGRLLDKRHFGQWLVDEALRDLVEGAAVMLEQLSAGQYSLTTAADGELLVVDHVNADETRPVRGLSGGETFQASLALALALSQHVAQLPESGAAALESIFLDEGFGSLDPETLDVVAGTIESLGHGERIVGVVTHVPDLAERMPVRLRVRKTAGTATVTREDT